MQNLQMHDVLIYHPQTIVREGLRALLDQSGRFHVCHQASRPEEALERASQCRLVLAELGVDSLQLAYSANLPMLCLMDTHPVLSTVTAAMRAGVRGFAGIHDVDEVLNGAEAVLQGRSFLSPSLGLQLLQTSMSHVLDIPLSEREREILDALVAGDSLLDIASHLCLSPSTVKTLQGRLYRKLKVRSREAAIRWALEQRQRI